MKVEDIKKVIYTELKKIAPDTMPEALKPDENYLEILDIDSFDALQFIVAIDEMLGINIPEEDYGKINTIQNLVNYIVSKK